MIETVNLFTDAGLVPIGVTGWERWEMLDTDGTDSYVVWLENGACCVVDLLSWAPGVLAQVTTSPV